MAFSGDMQSKCARAAQVTVDIFTPTVKWRGFPLRGYAATLLAFCGVAAHCDLQGRKVKRNGWRSMKIWWFPPMNSKDSPEIERQVSDFAGKFQLHPFMSWSVHKPSLRMAGPGGGQAGVFGWSAVQKIGSTHFLCSKAEVIVLISPPNSPARSRLEEVEEYMAYLRRPLA
ncbi:MAG: hypothetical protein ACLSB9_27215 [Hydrogeniiclostridium mannosilyticum]